MNAENQNNSRNPARFFTHNRQIAWVALLATLAWGVFGYMNMPKRKDPDIPVRIALAISPVAWYLGRQGRAVGHAKGRASRDWEQQSGPRGIHHAGQHLCRTS